MASETNKIAEETTVLSGSGFPVDPVLRILWRGIRKGACCYDDGGDIVCSDSLSHFACDVLGGTFVPHATCADDPCMVGACCCPDDPSCFITSQAVCEACCPECEFQGEGSECDPNPCGGACCGDDGCFDALDETDCIDSGGTYRGDGVVCDSEISPCGACCYTVDGETICDDSLSDTDCSDLSGEFFQGDTCGDAPCRGACCEDGGTICEDLSEADCATAGGNFKGINTACSDDPDPCICPACPDPDDPDVAVGFTGITFCGCVSIVGGGSLYVEEGITGINTGFGLSNVGPGHWIWTGSQFGTITDYSTDDCSGDPTISARPTNPDQIDVYCNDTDGFKVIAASQFGSKLVFSNAADASSSCDVDSGVIVLAGGGETRFEWAGSACENTSDNNLNCCPPCPTDVTLVCDQVCIEGAKCGWSGTFNSGAPTDTYWQTATTETATHFDTRDEVGNGTICDADAHTTVTGNHPVTFAGEFCDPSDGTEVACSGTSVCHCYNTVCDGECSTDDDCSGGFCSAGICCTNGVPVGTETCDFCSSVCDSSSCFGNANVNPAITFQVGNAVADNEWSFDAGFLALYPNTSGSTTFSGEITTAILLSTMAAALPSYDDDFNDTCEAKRIDLDEDNRHFNICRFKPKFTFSSAALNFTINYNEHFVPQGGGSATDTPKSVMVSIGDTEAIGDEVMEPGTNGTITITDIEVTCE